MYDLIYQIINHVWDTSSNYSSTEQQMIYAVSCIVICLLITLFVDLFYRFFKSIFKKGEF